MNGTVPLVLASALLHALWNALLKREADPERSIVAIMTVAAATSSAFAIATVHAPFPTASSFAWGAAAGAFEAGYFVTLARALARAPLGPVYTVSRGGALLVVWPISAIWFGETPRATTIAGTVLVLCGLASTGADRAGDATPVHTRGLAWAVLTAAFIAGYHLCYKRALDEHGAPAAIAALSLTVACALRVAPLGRAGAGAIVRAARSGPGPILLAGVLATGSFVVFLVALGGGGAGAVLTLRNTSVLFTQAIAWAMGERLGPLRVVGAVLVAGGAALLAWR